MKKLIQKEIIEESPIKDGIVKTTYKREVYMKCTPQGRKKIYQLKDPILIYNLIIVYRKKLFTDDETNYFLKYLIFFGEKRKILNDPSKIEKDLTNLFYEAFPHPYHVRLKKIIKKKIFNNLKAMIRTINIVHYNGY